MSTGSNHLLGSDSSVWIENLVNGLSGISIKAKHALFCESSPFQKIEVFDTYSYGKILILAGTVVFTEKDEYIYNEMITHPALIAHKKPENVCIIGGGDGGALREALKHPEVKSVTVVDIDELVITATKRFFAPMSTGFGDPRTTIVIDDGYAFLNTTKNPFDVILVDAFDPGGPVQSLATADFFQLVHKKLASGGIAVFQTDSPTFRSNVIRETFHQVKMLFPVAKPYLSIIPSFPEGVCSFIICGKDKEQRFACDQERCTKIVGDCGYYNEEIHTGAFMLPQYLKQLLVS